MSTVKKRGLQDMQYIGPSKSLAFGIGAMSVFVVVPHSKQVPRSRVVMVSATLFVSKANSFGPCSWRLPPRRGVFFDTFILSYYLC